MRLALSCLALFLAWALSPLAAQEPGSLSAPDRVQPGEAFPIRLSLPYPARASVLLWTPGSSKALLFPAWPRALAGAASGRAEGELEALVAIPADSPLCEAQLLVTIEAALPADGAGPQPWSFPGTSPGRLSQLGRTLQVQRRNFKRETIDLTPSMNEIRGSTDPLKEEQSQRYAAVLAAVDREARWLPVLGVGAFIRPVASQRLTAWFGDQRLYRYPQGATEQSRHWGVDFGVPRGTPILVPGRGKVVMAEKRISTGWTVILEHAPGVYTIYMHLDSLSVALDTVVEQAQILGRSGQTGFATGPHLHWELRVSGVAADPEAWYTPPPRQAGSDSGEQALEGAQALGGQ